MPPENAPQEKKRLHPRNRNQERYDLSALINASPELADYVKPNKFGVVSVDFSNPIAVKLLNKALLHHYYGIKYWDFPAKNLCPPIPGRADYLHHLADLLSENNAGKIPTGDKITCLDIGVGASCIYPVIGVIEYNWNFIGSDIDPKSLKFAQKIIHANPSLKGKINCKLQAYPNTIFHGIIDKTDKIEATICNPPFHASVEAAQKGTCRKVKNLSGKKVKRPTRNFGGSSNELVCEGGEYQFIQNMIRESKKYAANCYWFSSLVSKQANLKGIYKALERCGVAQIKTIPMGTSHKASRIVAWTFLSNKERKEWRISRWLNLPAGKLKEQGSQL